MQDSCTAKEVSIDGGRIDCVKVSSGVCKVIEIKPVDCGVFLCPGCGGRRRRGPSQWEWLH